MQWNLRLAAAQRGIWRSSDLRRLLAEAGLEISAGKMSHLWSGRPISIRLDDLDVICAVRQLRAGPPAPGRGAVRPLLPAVADPPGPVSGLRRTAPGLAR